MSGTDVFVATDSGMETRLACAGIASRLAPNSHELDYGRHAGPAPWDARRAAVLVLLTRVDGEWSVPLIERAVDGTVHSGQIGFPGGRLEANETPEAGAVREAEEEVGLRAADYQLIGRLSPVYIYASNHEVIPCLAVARRSVELRPSPDEVAGVFWLPIAALFDARRRGGHLITRWGASFETPHLHWEGRSIWGATRIMLDELAARWDVVRCELAALV